MHYNGLEDSESRYRQIVELSPDAIYTATEGKITYINPAGVKLLGAASREELLGFAIMDLIHPDFKEIVAERIRHLRDEKTPVPLLEEKYLRLDGSVVDVEVSTAPLLEQGRAAMQVIVRDITERKRAEEERLAHLRFFENLDQVNQALQRSNDLEQMTSEVLEAALELFGCDRAWLFYPCDPEAPTWHVPMERTRPEYPGAYAFGGEHPMTAGTAEVLRTIRNASGVVKFGPGTEPPLEPELAQRFGYQSQITMALYPKGDKPYVFGLHQCSYPRIWTPEEERLFQEVGRRLADALTSLLIYRDLQKSEEKYRLLVKQIPAVVFKGYSDGSVDFFDDKIEALTGYSKEDFSSRRLKWPDLIIAADQQGAREKFIEALQTSHSYVREYRIRKKSGEIGWVQTMGQIFLDAAGQIDFISGVVFEITARKEAEVASATERQRFYSLLEAMPAYLGLMTPDYRVAFANLYFRKDFGEPEGRTCYDYIFGRSEPCENCQAFKVLETGKEEYEWVGPNGRIYQVCDQLVHDTDGSPLILEMGIDITERKQAEEVLRRSEQRKTVLNQIANAFLTISDNEMYAEVLAVVLQVMKSKFGVFGYIGANGDLVVPSMTREVWGKCQIPDKSIVFPPATWGDSLWGKAIREKRAFFADGPFHTPESHISIDNFLTVPIVFGNATIGLVSVANREQGYSEEDRDLLEGIANHIAPILNARLQRDWEEQERKRAEEELRETMRRNQLILDSLPSAALLIRGDMTVVATNKAAALAGGVPGQHCYSTLWGLAAACHWCKAQEALQTGKLLQVEIKTADKVLEVHWVPINSDLFLHFVNDITELKEAEQDRAKLREQLFQAQKMEAIGTLAGGIAHDFNNILTAIIGYGEMLELLHSSECPQIEPNLHQILKAAFRAKDLVQQILTFSRKTNIDRKPINLLLIIKESLKFLRASLPSTIEIIQSLDPEVGVVLADPTQMQQVVMNLCTNAAQSMSARGGVIEVQLTEVAIEERNGGKVFEQGPGLYARLTVKDNGPGMPPEILERIFDPYFTTKGVGEGTGLGLAVAEGIVQSHGGVITVESQPGVGTVFQVFIPILGRSEIDLQTVTTAEIPRGQGRILFVDDEPALTNIGQQLLTILGYEVEGLTSSTTALEHFRHHPQRYDLAILDLTMPEMTGVDLAREMLQIRPDLPIILTSGFAEQLGQEEFKKVGIRELVQKPFRIKNLAETIKKVLG